MVAKNGSTETEYVDENGRFTVSNGLFLFYSYLFEEHWFEVNFPFNVTIKENIVNGITTNNKIKEGIRFALNKE